MTDSFSDSFEVSHSLRLADEMSTEIGYGSEGASEPMALVQKYQRYRATLFLAHIDYLTVTYRASLLGIRKKREKRPAPHENVTKIRKAVAAIEYWREYQGLHWKPELECRNEVPEPYAISVVSAEHESPGYIDSPRTLSLYSVSNIAFPLKWVKRKGDWTEEELLRIEELEYKAKEASWCRPSLRR